MNVPLLKEAMLMNDVEFSLKIVVVSLFILQTYWMICYGLVVP